MSEQTGTPTTTTEGASTAAAASTSLLTGTEGAATTTQQATTTANTPASTTAAATEAASAATTEAGTTAAEGTTTAETKPAGAPEKYEFKAPEGKEYDAAVLEPFSEAAKAANLTQDAAQALLDSMAPKLAAREEAQVKAIQDGWTTASKTDAEFGGDKLEENLGIAKKALDTFAPKNADGSVSGFRKLLDETRLGNHPEVIRMLVRVGKAMGEDGFVPGTGKPASKKDAADVLYDRTAKA